MFNNTDAHVINYEDVICAFRNVSYSESEAMIHLWLAKYIHERNLTVLSPDGKLTSEQFHDYKDCYFVKSEIDQAIVDTFGKLADAA